MKFFLLKAIIICAVLAVPFKKYDQWYGQFYRYTATKLFGKFHGSGFAMFNPTDEVQMTQINVGNYKSMVNGQVNTGVDKCNTRFRGYLPTILLISLVGASSIPWPRKTIALIIGFVLVTAVVMLKQWLHILYMCKQYEWVNLYTFSEEGKTKIDMIQHNYVASISPTLAVVVVIWVLISFRITDLKKVDS